MRQLFCKSFAQQCIKVQALHSKKYSAVPFKGPQFYETHCIDIRSIRYCTAEYLHSIHLQTNVLQNMRVVPLIANYRQFCSVLQIAPLHITQCTAAHSTEKCAEQCVMQCILLSNGYLRLTLSGSNSNPTMCDFWY